MDRQKGITADKMAGRHGKGRPSITRHRLFPIMVAVWFGALFALGILVLRPAVIEAMVARAHLVTVPPAAAPPLGMTARLLLALGLGLIGAVAGYGAGRMLARPSRALQSSAKDVDFAGAAADLPTIPTVPIQPQAAEAEAVATRRRRPLAIASDLGPRFDEECAPLPGSAPQVLDVSAFDFCDDLLPEPAVGDEPARIIVGDAIECPRADAVEDPAPTAVSQVSERRAFDPPAGTVATQSLAEPLPSAPPAHPSQNQAPQSQVQAYPLPPILRQAFGSVEGRILDREISELSHLELVERLAYALQRRRVDAAMRAAEPQPPLPRGGADCPPGYAQSAGFAENSVTREAEANWGVSEPVDDYRAFIPQRRAAITLSPHADWGDEAEEDVDVVEDSYSSLLAIGRPAGLCDAWEMEEESDDSDGYDGVVAFPTHAAMSEFAAETADDHAQTERALREALANLQRLSATG
ncbi:MAG: hypothetical protein WCY11_03120 [Novosphingobium sp.]